MIAYVRIVNYAGDMFFNHAKMDRFLEEISRDLVYGPIMRDLNNYGFELRYSFRGNGLYKPQIIFAKDADMLCNIERSPVTLYLSCRHGAGNAAYEFLHEAYHFYQDSFGMFCTPLLYKEQAAVLLDLKSFIHLVYFCEAMAATESIRAAWRLREAGNDLAWCGISHSLNWRKISNQYVSNAVENGGVLAAQRLFSGWYGSIMRRRFYERQSIKLWRDIVKTAEEKTGMPVNFVSVTLSEILHLMPSVLRPSYLQDMDLDQSLFTPSLSSRAQKFHINYGEGTSHCASLKNGSPIYLWRKSAASS